MIIAHIITTDFGNKILNILDIANDYLWTYIVITMLVACALYFTFRIHGAQFSMLKEMIHLLKNSGSERRPDGTKPISSFRAFAVSLSSRVGTGNLAGVASAIFIGGPGAVFWMWIMAILGSATAFIEATLAQLYKRKGERSFYGGPAYYMESGLHRRWMGVLFAILITITFSFANQMVQSTTLCDSISDTLGFNKTTVGIALAICTLIIIFGGIQRISKFSAIIVPIMAIGYIALALFIIICNITIIPDIIKNIIQSAFGFEQAVGGTFGAAIMQGVKRGLFSNEAGEGSAPNAAAIAEISHPIKQGLLQAFGVFTDTLIICTCTAFIILIAGLYNGDADGIILTSQSIEHEIGPAGRYFLTAAIFLFAYSTIISNYFYGETNLRFITNKKWVVFLFRLLTGLVVIAGALMSLQTAWSIVDIFMGLMTICNLIAITLLSGKAIRLLKDYKQQRKQGLDPQFNKNILLEEDINDIECW